uniref:CSON010389 protein n=1 Tax=Culicoides sonorensis TaxID=179676 RepID=A0A336K6D6_CULSO
MSKYTNIFLLLTFITLSESFAPLKMCMHSFETPDTCTFKDVILNKTDIEFTSIFLPEVTKIHFTKSSIPKLGSSICARIFYDIQNSPNIIEIHLTRTKIEEVTSNAFSHCPNLQVINLRNNLIEVLPTDAFNRNKNLENLDLSSNLIERLENEIFFGLKKLRELKLSGNKFKSISSQIFEGLTGLEVLRLDSNDLFDLNLKKILTFTLNLKKMAYNNNQMRCNHIKNMNKMLRERKINLDTEYEGELRTRSQPSELQDEIICLNDLNWVILHYIFIYSQ